MKRKKIAARILLVLSILILPCLAIEPVYAATSSTGDITIQLTKLTDTSYEGVEFSIYKVGNWSWTTETWTLDNAFLNTSITLSTLDTNDKWDAAAKTLAKHAELSKATTYTAITDSNGKKQISDLALGMYLIVQTSATDTYGTISPFLVGLPIRGDGNTYSYTLTVNPKAEKTKSDDPESGTGTGTGSGGNNTGNTGNSSNSSNSGNSGNSSSSSGTESGQTTTESTVLESQIEEILEETEQEAAQELLETPLYDAANEAEDDSDPADQQTTEGGQDGGQLQGAGMDADNTDGSDAGNTNDADAGSENADGNGSTSGNANDTNEESGGGLGTVGTVAAVCGGVAAIGGGCVVAANAMGQGSMIGWKRRKK